MYEIDAELLAGQIGLRIVNSDTQFDNLKVVLLGQDPYHNVGQAHGLCFSVQDGIAKPPSLENIFKTRFISQKKWYNNNEK